MSENKWFKFRVIETTTVEKVYTLRAPTEEEARKMAENGESVHEFRVNGAWDVVNREVGEQIHIHQEVK